MVKSTGKFILTKCLHPSPERSNPITMWNRHRKCHLSYSFPDWRIDKKDDEKALVRIISTRCGEICQSLYCLGRVSHHMTATLRPPGNSIHPTSTTVCSHIAVNFSPDRSVSQGNTIILAIVDSCSKPCHLMPFPRAPYSHENRLEHFQLTI